MKVITVLITLAISLVAPSIFAAAPKCYAEHGGYCTYQGKVSRLYVNSGNIILIYFDTPVDLAAPAGIGLNVANAGAAAFSIETQPEFAHMFYSTALAAQASGREIYIQMRGVQSGFLQFDRIWLAE